MCLLWIFTGVVLLHVLLVFAGAVSSGEACWRTRLVEAHHFAVAAQAVWYGLLGVVWGTVWVLQTPAGCAKAGALMGTVLNCM